MNSIIGTFFDKYFIRDKDPHKYALLWSTKFHQFYNNVVRQLNTHNLTNEQDISEFFSSRPNSRQFAKHFIEYFYTYGVYKKKLSKFEYLYRGLNSKFLLQEKVNINDPSFISTTYSFDVAQKFATNQGNILNFAVKDLPDDIPFIIINEKLGDHLQEDEVVFLPGKLYVRYKNNKYFVKYKMNEVLVSTIRSRMYAGADVTESEKKILHMSKVPRLSLRGKGAVYYRKVYNRPVEIIHCVWFPKKASDITRFAKERLEPIERFHQDGLTLIPEYIDLQMKIQEDNRKDLKSRDDLFQKQNSYNIFMAIYNWKTRQVEHYHYGWLDWMLSEGGYMHIINSKNDIEKTIQDYMRHHEALVNNRW